MNHRFYHSFEARFWDSVNTGSPDECWEWKLALDSDGYGAITVDDKAMKAHRIALSLSGVSVDGKVACHKCDNRACCNPAHLYAGTHDDNMRDRSERGRVPKGRDCWAARLNEDIVWFARVFHGAGVYSTAELARRFGVSHPAMRKVIERRSWKHVP